MAFRYFGYTTEAVQAHIANWLDKSMKGETNYLPANRELLAYLRENKIPLLPFDANFTVKGNGSIGIFGCTSHS